MKKIIIFTTLALIAANGLAGLLISGYQPFNAIATSIALLITGILLYTVARIPLKDAFRVSLVFIISFIGLVLYLLMLFAKPQLQDNWCVIAGTVVLVIETVFIYIAYILSKKNIDKLWKKLLQK